MKLLFVNACIRNEKSRTKKLCDTYISEFQRRNPQVQVEEVKLDRNLVAPITDEEIDMRTEMASQKRWDHPEFKLANQFRNADYILVGAPYWDLSFPSVLKAYIERIMIAGLTFSVENLGEKKCKSEMLTYIVTCGGPLIRDYGYEYIQGIANVAGINSTQRFYAEKLDIVGQDIEAILMKTKEEIRKSFKKEENN